jgi:hypothetical protein
LKRLPDDTSLRTGGGCGIAQAIAELCRGFTELIKPERENVPSNDIRQYFSGIRPGAKKVSNSLHQCRSSVQFECAWSEPVLARFLSSSLMAVDNLK